MALINRLTEMTKYAGEGYALQAFDAEWNAEMLADVPVHKLEAAHAGVTATYHDGGFAFSGDDIAIHWGKNA